MSFKLFTKLAYTFVLFPISISFAQMKSDSVPLPQGCTAPIARVEAIGDFDGNGLPTDLWVVGAFHWKWNVEWTVEWYGIYSLTEQKFLYSKKLSAEGANYNNISDITIKQIGTTQIYILFNGTLLSYKDIPTLLKKKL
jgi:hypothetical protein